MIDYQRVIDKYYESGSRLRAILIQHSANVKDLALEIARKHNLPLDPSDIVAAAMLHDIGIFRTYAPSIECFGESNYICHGVIGAELLRQEGLPEWLARVAERHTGSGLTKEDIVLQHLPLPQEDFMPETLLEKLICYADSFYSKGGDMQRKSLDRVRKAMLTHGSLALERFDGLHAIFG